MAKARTTENNIALSDLLGAANAPAADKGSKARASKSKPAEEATKPNEEPQTSGSTPEGTTGPQDSPQASDTNSAGGSDAPNAGGASEGSNEPTTTTTESVDGFTFEDFDVVPSRHAKTAGRSMYPFPTMQPGDYFFIPFVDKKDEKTRPQKLATASSAHNRLMRDDADKKGWRLVVRVTEDDGKLGVGAYMTNPAHRGEEDESETATA